MDFDHDEECEIIEAYEKQKTKGKINFKMIMKCYDVCVNDFRGKRLDPREKECMIPCMKNLYAVSLEVVNGLYFTKQGRKK